MVIYRLEIIDENGVRVIIAGEQNVMESAYDELKKSIDQVHGVGQSVIEMHGITDSADRAEHKLFIKVRSVVSASLVQLYGK